MRVASLCLLRSRAIKGKISILFGTVNRPDCVANLLASIREYSHPVDHEVIVVDSGKTHPCWSAVQGHPNLQYFQDDNQDGFARAYNRGSRLATGEFLIWLNDDCLVTPGWLSATLKFMRETPRVGIGGLTFSEGKRVRVQQKIFEVYYPNFGCIRTDLWFKLGGFDELYHSYGAETDLAFRALAKGYSVLPIPDVLIEHLRFQDSNRKKMSRERQEGLHQFRRRWGKQMTNPVFQKAIK